MKSPSSGKAEVIVTGCGAQRSSRCHTGEHNLRAVVRFLPDIFHFFAAKLKGTALLGRSAHSEVLWGPLTLGGDGFHYHINDNDRPSAANPSAARRGGQSEQHRP